MDHYVLYAQKGTYLRLSINFTAFHHLCFLFLSLPGPVFPKCLLNLRYPSYFFLSADCFLFASPMPQSPDFSLTLPGRLSHFVYFFL